MHFSQTDWNPPQTDKNITKSMETPADSSVQKHLKLPRDVDAHSFAKFTNVYFRTHEWAATKSPIETPFLSKSNDADFHQSLSIFKLVCDTFFCFQPKQFLTISSSPSRSSDTRMITL
jgi:hypothetical protein